MNRQSSKPELIIWQRIVEEYQSFVIKGDSTINATVGEFLREKIDRGSILKDAFKQGDIETALYVASFMRPEELLQLFENLVFLAAGMGSFVVKVRKIICSLPRAWVIANIETVAEPLLLDKVYAEDSYRGLLELYSQLDPKLVLRLAHRAAEHFDPNVREAGESFLEYLESISKR